MSEVNQLKIKAVSTDSNVHSYSNGVLTLKNGGKFTVVLEEFGKLSKIEEKHQKAIKNKSKDVESKDDRIVWICKIVESNLNFNASDYDPKLGFGELKKTLVFPDFLEGGGFIYIEAYRQNTQPANSLGVGMIVQAIGTPNILGVEWYRNERNNKSEKLKKRTKVQLGSTIQLHIYTQGLYGQDIEVMLMDLDMFSDDILAPLPRENTKGEIPPMPSEKKMRVFTREVRAYKQEPSAVPSYAKRGNLVTVEGDKHIKHQYVQKIITDVYIDPFWVGFQYSNESRFEIYAKVKHNKSKDFIKFDNDSVFAFGKTIISKLTPEGNKPVLTGIVETDPADFYACRYNTISFSKRGEAPIVVFNSNDPLLRKINPVHVDIIAGKKETYYLDIDFETEDCENISGLHTDKIQLSSYDKNFFKIVNLPLESPKENKIKKEKNIKISAEKKKSINGVSSTTKGNIEKEQGLVTIRKKQLEIETLFDYDIPDNTMAGPLMIYSKAMKYFWLPNLKDEVRQIILDARSCAFNKCINVSIYPDIKWTLKFGFNVEKETIEALNKRGIKAPFGYFEKLEEKTNDYQRTADEKDQKYLGGNKGLRRVKIEELDKARKKFKLKSKGAKEDIVGSGDSKGFLNVLNKVKISLAEEHYGGEQKNELNEEFVKILYEKFVFVEVIHEALSIIEGKKDSKTYSSKDIKGIDKLKKKLNRKITQYDIHYPKFAFAASWFYELVDPVKYPLLAGRQGLALDINLSAKPLLGVSIKWDLLELLCRKHPLAYAILKAIDSLIAILFDDTSAVRLDFIVENKIDFEIDWQHNMLAGFNDISGKGKYALNLKLNLEISIASTYKVLYYGVITKLGFGAGASSCIGIIPTCGVDALGFYIQLALFFEGIKLEFSATISLEGTKEKKGKKITLFKKGKEIKGDITLLNYTFETDKFYIKN